MTYQAFERAFTLALGVARGNRREKAFCKAFPHNPRCELANEKEGYTATTTKGMNVITLKTSQVVSGVCFYEVLQNLVRV